MEHLSGSSRSTRKVESSRGSWRPNTTFLKEKLLQRENNLLKAGAKIQPIEWKCPPKMCMPDKWRIVGGEESVELEAQRQREKSVAEEVYIHPYSIPSKPPVALDLGEQSQDDKCIFYVPEEEPEEGEFIPPCNNCASSSSSKPSPVANTSSSDIINIDPAVVVAIIAEFVKSIQIELIDDDDLISLLRNPELIEKLMKGLAPKPNNNYVSATTPSASTANTKQAEAVESMAISRPVDEALPYARVEPAVFGLNNNNPPKPAPMVRSSSKGLRDERRAFSRAEIMPNMAAGRNNPLSRTQLISRKINPIIPHCKFFDTSKGCRNGSKCRFWHDLEAPHAKRMKK